MKSAVPVPAAADGGIDLSAIDPADAARALLLWVNSPSNPTGALSDLAAAAAWGRAHGVPVFSDECYVEFTWDGPASTIPHSGLEGVVAVHSLSKRSNLAGDRGRHRLGRLAQVRAVGPGLGVPMPAGSFYLWFDAHDGWQFAERLAREGGALVSPGDFYGAGGAHNVRAAVVQPDDRIELVATRLGVQ